MPQLIIKNFSLENSEESTIPKLRKILKEKFEIDVPSHCDKFLERCLRQKDGKVEKAAQLVQTVHQGISDFKHWNAKLDPRCYETTFYKLPVACVLATRDKLGRRVYVAQLEHWNPDQLNFEEWAAAIWMMSIMALTKEEDQKHGFVAIWNLDKFSLRQAYALNMQKCVKMCRWTQGGVLGRVKGIHIVNHPKVVGLIYDGIKPFLSEKMRNRVKFHKNLSDLQDSLEMELTSLPKMCGGNLEVEEYMDKEFMKDLLNSAEYFEDMLKNGFPDK